MSSSSAPPLPPSPPFNMQSSLEKIFMHIDYHITSSNGNILEIKKSTLIDYISTIPKIVSLLVPGERTLEELNALSNEIKKLIIALLQIFKDLFDNGLCLQSLTADDIVILLDCHCTPKLKENITFVQSNENMINLNMLWLGQLLRDEMLLGCELPMEVKDFLNLFMANGCANKDLIFVHSVIVDLDDQNDYFCGVHDFLLKILKELNPSDYNDILRELVFPENWDLAVLRNQHLKDCYEGRDMGKGRKKNKKGKGAAASTEGSGQSVRAGNGALETGQPGGSTGAGTGALESGEPSGGIRAGAQKSTQLAGSIGAGTRAPHGKQLRSLSKSNVSGSTRVPVYVPRNGQPINNTQKPTKHHSDQSGSLKRTNNILSGTGVPYHTSQPRTKGGSIGAGNETLESGEPSSSVGVTAALKSSQLAGSMTAGTRASQGKQSGIMSKSSGQPINHSMPMEQQSSKPTNQASNKGIPSGLHPNTRPSSAQRSMLGKTASQTTKWVPKKVQQTKMQAPDVAKLKHATSSPAAKSIPAEVSPSGCTAESSSMGAKKTYNRPGSNPGKEALKFYRNGVQHGLDYAIENGRLLYGPRGLAIMLLFHFSLLLSSALKAIHRRGYLSSMENLPRLLR